MKKTIFVTLLAVMMLFAFVACDNNTQAPAKLSVSIPSEVYGAKASAFGTIEFSSEIEGNTNNVAVSGEFAYLTAEDFAEGTWSTEAGYFLPFKLDGEFAEDATFTMTKNLGSEATSESFDLATNRDNVIYIGNSDYTNNCTVTITEGETTYKIVFDFTEATFAPQA